MFRRRIASIVIAACLAMPLGAAASQAATKCSSNYNSKTCVTTSSRTGSTFVVGYRDSVRNGLKSTISASCTATSQKVVKYSVGTSVSASVKGLIFASMDATLSAGIDKSMSTGYSTSASFKVKPGSTVKCDRGIYTENAKGYTVLNAYSAGKGTTKKSNWTAKAPSRSQWRIY